MRISIPYGSSRASGEASASGQHDIDDQRILQVLRNPFRRGNGQVPDEVEGEGGQNGERNVRGRPGRGNPDHATARISERSKIDRHRLGITEQERRAQQHEEAGQQDRPDRIDVLQGIEADASQPPRRLIAKEMRYEAMRRLMKSNGGN